MGLDCTHDAWHGAYSAFMTWREKLAEVAGLPPLHLMEGFYGSIKWDCLKPDPLYELLSHSDCDGDIPADHCAAIADSLERLIPLLPVGDAPGHIRNWRDKTAQFVAGLRAAAAAGEPLGFH